MSVFDDLFGKFKGGKRKAPSFNPQKDADLESLLPRPPRRIDQRAARKLIAGKRVLITGAGGTIGSELVRQTAAFEPAHLALVDNSEFNL